MPTMLTKRCIDMEIISIPPSMKFWMIRKLHMRRLFLLELSPISDPDKQGMRSSCRTWDCRNFFLFFCVSRNTDWRFVKSSKMTNRWEVSVMTGVSDLDGSFLTRETTMFTVIMITRIESLMFIRVIVKSLFSLRQSTQQSDIHEDDWRTWVSARRRQRISLRSCRRTKGRKWMSVVGKSSRQTIILSRRKTYPLTFIRQ